MTVLGDVLRNARTDAGVDQRALARRSGIGQAAVSRIETGRESPSFERFALLLSCLGLEASVEARPLGFRGDPADVALAREMTPGERLEAAFNAAAFGRELRARVSSVTPSDG
jgi:transcriptional regulator with XRE-family HTH domain